MTTHFRIVTLDPGELDRIRACGDDDFANPLETIVEKEGVRRCVAAYVTPLRERYFL